MCGIAGFLAAGRPAASFDDALGRMNACIAHRGPDGAGTWIDEVAGVALAHRRLAILDLSELGRQPMASHTGRYRLVFNGEIYNFRELARELAALGHAFRSRSDTEVLLAAVDQWGIDDGVRRLNGIFAFALWDARERLLHLVRDHLGVKPLYYGTVGATVVFASELRAIESFPGFGGEVDRGALALLLRHNCIPAPYSIYTAVRKLPPGSIVSVRAGAAAGEPRAFWSPREVAERGAAAPRETSDAEAIDALDTLLRDAVRMQMVSDVPLGAFLSGGIDSSTVVAMMQAQSTAPVRTFSIGFHEAGYDEAPHARAVARHLGTDHTELYVSPADALAVVPRLPRLYDEPFSDSSQVPTVLVSELARRSVAVSLSGDGGDELFAGYTRHFTVPRMWSRIRGVPAPLRRLASGAITAFSPEALTRGFAATGLSRSRRVLAGRIGYNLHKLADVLDAAGPEQMYVRLASHWRDPAAVVIGGTEPPTIVSDRARWARVPDFATQMLFLDLVTYLPDDILTKVDRASMSVALEARVPLLDPRVVEHAWRLPMGLKVRDGRGKWILREVLARYVPRALTDRPKAGFGVPIDRWLRGPLRDWAEAHLAEDVLRRDGFLRPEPIRAKWREHLTGRADWQYHLWDVLMFQAWLRERRP